jgi:hypothetical protein
MDDIVHYIHQIIILVIKIYPFLITELLSEQGYNQIIHWSLHIWWYGFHNMLRVKQEFCVRNAPVYLYLAYTWCTRLLQHVIQV